MAGFSDFMGAMRFGMGLVSGFTAQAEKERQANEAKQLKLLQLLKDDEHELVELPYAQIQPSGNILDALFGTGQARVSGTDEPAILVGNRGFVRRKYAPISIPSGLLESSGPATQPLGTEPAYPPPVRPFAPIAAPTAAAPTAAAPTAAAPTAAAPTAAAPAIPAQLRTQILSAVQKASEETGVPVAQLLALGQVESSFNPRAEAVSTDLRTGKVYKAQGLMQLIEETQQRQGVTQPFDIEQSILGGAKEWREALDKTGGDPRRAYLEVYNPNDPNRFKAAAKLQQLVSAYEQSPGVQAIAQGKFAGPGVVAPEQEVRRQNTPTTVAPKITSAPQFGEISLPATRTLEDYTKQEQRRAYTTLAPTLRDTAKGREKLGVALRDAETKAQTLYDRDFKTARAEADRIKRERQIHSYEVLNALDRVKDPEQLKVILDYIAKNPDPDHLGDSFQLLQQARSEDRPALMARLYPQLLAANYTDQAMKLQWKPFYDEMENKQKVALETELAPLREKASALQGAAGTEARIKAEQKARQDMTLREVVKDDATHFYDVTTGNRVNQVLPYSEVQQLVKAGKVTELTQEQQKRFDGTQMILPLIESIKNRIEKIWGPGGIFENLQPGSDRYQAMVRGGLARFFQEDPELSTLVRQIESNVDLVGRELQGQVGTQTEQDALRRLKSFPQATGVPDSQAVAYGTFNNLLDAMRGRLGKMLGNPAYRQSELEPLVTKKAGTPQSGTPAMNDTAEQAALRSQLKTKGWTDEQINKAIGR